MSALYTAFVAYFGFLQAGQGSDAIKVLTRAAEKADTTSWPYPVCQFLMNDISETPLLAFATDNSKKTQAYTYIGFNLSISKEYKSALSHLDWVLDNGNRDFWHYAFAIAESKRIRKILDD
jgi:lipoprotein NlpI